MSTHLKRANGKADLLSVGFGDPSYFADPSVSTLAGAAAASPTHNGNVQQIEGAWVEIDLTAMHTVATCNHNLYLDNEGEALFSGLNNVRWLVFGWQHSGQGILGQLTFDVYYDESETNTVNSIDLTFDIGPNDTVITVDGTYPVKATLFFTKAVR